VIAGWEFGGNHSLSAKARLFLAHGTDQSTPARTTNGAKGVAAAVTYCC